MNKIQEITARKLLDYHNDSDRILTFSVGKDKYSIFIDKENYAERNLPAMLAEPKIREYVELGILKVKTSRIEIAKLEGDGDLHHFIVPFQSADTDTFKVFTNGLPLDDKEFMVLNTVWLKGIYFQAGKVKKEDKMEIEFDHHVPESTWFKLMNDFNTIISILLLAKKPEDHSKRFFDNFQEVSVLPAEVIVNITNKINQLDLSEGAIKN